MNKFKGLSKAKKVTLILILLLILFLGGRASANALKTKYSEYKSEKIEQAADDFMKTKPKITANVDLNDTEKLDKNTVITISLPIPENSDYDYYYDYGGDFLDSEHEEDYKKVTKEWKKEINLLDWEYDGNLTSNYDVGKFKLTEKGKSVEESNYTDEAYFQSADLPIEEENTHAFAELVYKLKASTTAEKYDLKQYLDKKINKPLKVSGMVHFEEGSFKSSFIKDAEGDIFKEKFYGDDYEPDTEAAPARTYYQRLYMLDDKTGMKINLIYTSYYYDIDYPSGYTKDKIMDNLDDAKANAEEDYTEKLNNILAQNGNNKLLRIDANNTIYTTFSLSDSDKSYDEKTNKVYVNQDELLID